MCVIFVSFVRVVPKREPSYGDGRGYDNQPIGPRP